MTMKLPPELSILIVDDSKSATILIKQQLVGLGISHDKIYIATDYRQAIRTVERHTLDVLLIDYHLEQTFTGFELLGILYRKRLIDHTVATILLSGDMRQETVLTALSGKAHHFISKPIKTPILRHKISLAVEESHQITQQKQYYPIDSPSALQQALSVPHTQKSVQYEASLIEHLIGTEQWELLTYVLRESATNMHPTKLVAEALVLDSLGKAQQAIDKLHNYLIARPLSLNVIDCLSCIYEKHNMLLPALKLAIRAFELTPSISHRATRAIDLAENADNAQILIKMGHMYATNISPADIDVINSISNYFHSLQVAYEKEDSIANKRTLLEQANQFTNQVNLKLMQHQQQQVLAALAVFQCQVLHFEGNHQLAHQKLIRAAALLCHVLNETPTVLLNQLLPLLNIYGEYSLYQGLGDFLKARGEINDQTYLGSDTNPINCINIDSLGSVQQLKDYIHTYPYSVAAKLDYLFAVNKTQTEEQLTNEFMAQLQKLELPHKWNQWISESARTGFSTKPPSPLSLCS